MMTKEESMIFRAAIKDRWRHSLFSSVSGNEICEQKTKEHASTISPVLKDNSNRDFVSLALPGKGAQVLWAQDVSRRP